MKHNTFRSSGLRLDWTHRLTGHHSRDYCCVCVTMVSSGSKLVTLLAGTFSWTDCVLGFFFPPLTPQCYRSKHNFPASSKIIIFNRPKKNLCICPILHVASLKRASHCHHFSLVSNLFNKGHTDTNIGTRWNWHWNWPSVYIIRSFWLDTSQMVNLTLDRFIYLCFQVQTTFTLSKSRQLLYCL